MIGINIQAGLSNRLFKMVFAYVISKKYNIPYRFENWHFHSHHSKQNYIELIHRFMNTELYCKEPVEYEYRWDEPHNDFMSYLDMVSILPDILSKNIFIHGFFQNEKYFKEYREDILTLLAEPERVTSSISKYKDHLHFIENSYFIHVRLGDYLHMPKHFVDLSKYYIKCIEDIHKKEPNATFVVFSNQIHLINQVYPLISKTLTELNHQSIIIGEPDELVSFYLMKRCDKGGICSNSTFGWWAGWLNTNENKRLYMPSKWINIEVNNDIYPENAIIVDV